MVYDSYCCILSEYLTPTEVEYIHGYAKNLPLQEGRLGFDGKDGDSIKAREGNRTAEQMNGATFTITNGGIYGSMMSTPILNPPQSGILGLHQIKDRAIVENGEIKIRSMMYVALTYDHRAVSGKEAVSFLVKIKEFIEDPDRMLIGL